jgi:hypothetical protein
LLQALASVPDFGDYLQAMSRLLPKSTFIRDFIECYEGRMPGQAAARSMAVCAKKCVAEL